MADDDVVEYLRGKGYEPSRSGGEFAFPCPFCGEDPNSRKRKLYVNPNTGMFHCFICGVNGGSYVIHRHFGDVDTTTPVKADDLDELRSHAAHTAHAWLLEHDEMLLWLMSPYTEEHEQWGAGRGFTEHTIVDAVFGYVPKGWSLMREVGANEKDLVAAGLANSLSGQLRDPFLERLIIPYWRGRRCVQIRGRSMERNPKAKYMTASGQRVRVYNADTARGAREVLVVEGELDALAVHQVTRSSVNERLRSLGIVGLPGTQTLPEEFDIVTSAAKRIFVGFDADEAGRAGASRVAEHVGKRARVVSLPDGDWSEWLGSHAEDDVLGLLDEAAGGRLVGSVEASERWSRRQIENHEGAIQTGYAGFDNVIAPGLLPGQLLVLLAKPGSGKSLILCNMIINMGDVPTLLVSLEMTVEEIWERLLRVYRFHHRNASETDAEQALAHVWICDENMLAAGDLSALCDEFELEHGEPPRVVMVDYLQYYARGMPGSSPYETTTYAVMQLKAEAKERGVTVIVPSQVNRMSKEGRPIDMEAAKDSSGVEDTADFLVSLYRPELATMVDDGKQPSGRIIWHILKSRHGGKGRQWVLVMDMLTLAIVEASGAKAKAVESNNYLHWRGTTYADFRRRQLQLGTGDDDG